MYHWKFFTKPYFCLNPAGKSKVPSWKFFISLLENYFFSVGKSNFRSRAIWDGVLGSLLNYFKRFLFILKPCAVRQLKVKMFDSERWVMSIELWVFSTKEQKKISFYETHSSKPRLPDVLVRRSELTTHCSQLIAQNILCLILLARFARFAWFAWVKTSDAARRRPYLS